MLSSLPPAYAQTIGSFSSSALANNASNARHSATNTTNPPAPQPLPAPPTSPRAPSPPLHPLVQLLPPTSSPSTTAALASSLPPPPSDYLSPSTAVHPYFLCCLTCSTPLSDCFHVTDGDDVSVTVNALYQAVSIPSELEVSPELGAYYPVHCGSCGASVGRYYRFTGPQQINRCNMFELQCSAVRVQLLGKASVRGEEYATETGIATRLTQLLLSHEAMREDIRQLRQQLSIATAQPPPTHPQPQQLQQQPLPQATGKRKREENAEQSSTSTAQTTAATAPSEQSNGGVEPDSGEESDLDDAPHRTAAVATTTAAATEEGEEKDGDAARNGLRAGRGGKRGRGGRGRGGAERGQRKPSTRGRGRGKSRQPYPQDYKLHAQYTLDLRSAAHGGMGPLHRYARWAEG